MVITCERCDALGLNVASNVACSPLLMMTDAAWGALLAVHIRIQRHDSLGTSGWSDLEARVRVRQVDVHLQAYNTSLK